jgi:hypothetical protein
VQVGFVSCVMCDVGPQRGLKALPGLPGHHSGNDRHSADDDGEISETVPENGQ